MSGRVETEDQDCRRRSADHAQVRIFAKSREIWNFELAILLTQKSRWSVAPLFLSFSFPSMALVAHEEHEPNVPFPPGFMGAAFLLFAGACRLFLEHQQLD